MSRWRDQLNAQLNSVSSNALSFVQGITSELTTENELDPATELQVKTAFIYLTHSFSVPQRSVRQARA
jgi:predicted aconitase